MITVTLDTTVVRDYLSNRPGRAEVERLIELAEDGKVDLAVTARIYEDIPRPPLSDKIMELPELGISIQPSVTRLGFWVLGRDVLASDEFAHVTQPQGGLEKDWKDNDHVHAHYVLKRDVFLTSDRGLLERGKAFKLQFGIEIIEPKEFLKRFDQAPT